MYSETSGGRVVAGSNPVTPTKRKGIENKPITDVFDTFYRFCITSKCDGKSIFGAHLGAFGRYWMPFTCKIPANYDNNKIVS